MTTLTSRQVAALAYDAGWRGNNVITATAIAHAESGNRTDAVGPTLSCGQGAQGLFQINVCVNHCSNPTDPKANTACAYRVFRSQGWNAWSTYKSGAYKQYIMDATQAYQGAGNQSQVNEILKSIGIGLGYVPGASGLTDLASNPVLQGFQSIITFMNRIGSWISNADNWVRVMKVIVGGVVIIVGLGIVAKDTGLNNLPAGKIIKRFS
jgi:Lysozyme like domain